MKYLKIFENWINEAAVTADQIAQQIQQAVGGTGTDEEALVNAIKSIPDSASLVKVNQSLKIGVANKNWDYLSVGDAINGELGLLDQSYRDQINTHIKNIRGEQYLGSFTAPPPPVDPVIKSIQDRVIKHEGSKPAKYIDSRGNPTIGVGFNLTRSDSSEQLKKVGANPEKIKSGKAQLTQSQISALLFVDLTKAKASAQTLISKNGQADISKVWQTLPITVQGVLTEMIFNLGKNGLSEFNDFLTFITKKKFTAAAQEMLRSSWAKQVGQRANNLAQIMQSVRLAERIEEAEISEKKRLEWNDSDAPDAKGKFKELGIQKLADWLIRTRGGNMQKITGSLNQQINFNKKKNPSYAKKMESTREAVKRKLEKRKNK
jgi:GH24 family phage-related lysozyme (muramidase)